MLKRSLEYTAGSDSVRVIDQRRLPAAMDILELRRLEDFHHAIADMVVRGAPLIGVTAAFGLAFALRDGASDESLARARDTLLGARPTAVNLAWALRRVEQAVIALPSAERATAAFAEAAAIAEEDVGNCRRIGEHGLRLLRDLAAGTDGERPLQIMTHCNAGSLATLELGTATAPIYLAQAANIPVHVWVSETRPRNQGAKLTAWELARAGVPATIIADNAAGILMREGRVDCCLVGSDRTAANGDVCNKVGTYLKALAARDCGVPFYVALPESTIDWQCGSGEDIPIEERSPAEVLDEYSPVSALNPAFDVTPAGLVDALVTEHGVFSPGDLEALRRQLGR